jgi:hypothetical protein
VKPDGNAAADNYPPLSRATTTDEKHRSPGVEGKHLNATDVRDEFFVDGGDHTRLASLHHEAGKMTGLVLNPGPGRSRVDGSTDRDKTRRDGSFSIVRYPVKRDTTVKTGHSQHDA